MTQTGTAAKQKSLPWLMLLTESGESPPPPPPPENPKWGVGSEVCCTTSPATFSVTNEGTTKKSTIANCSSDPTWEGWVTTTAGNKSFSWILSSSTCGTYSGAFNHLLSEGYYYLFVISIDNGNLVIYVYKSENPTMSENSAKASMQPISKMQLNIPQGVFSENEIKY